MIELKDDLLVFSFPEVHPEARLEISMQRTLRIPDDGQTYPLPPGLGQFPLRHLDDYADRVPSAWLARGGVITPLYQAEALWLSFESASVVLNDAKYPFAVKVAAGKVNAVTGTAWRDELVAAPQDYVVAPEQPWLDGYCVEKGRIRQFVAMPLGAGYTAEEQLTGEAEFGGLQILVRPMRREVFERRFSEVSNTVGWAEEACELSLCECDLEDDLFPAMGLAPGGRMRQKIYDDPFNFGDWSTEHASRCFVHLVNSWTWRGLTGEEPPTVPFTAFDYEEAGLPWFDIYDESVPAVEGSSELKGMKSVFEMGDAKGDSPLPENASVSPEKVHVLPHGASKYQVREGDF